MSVKVIQDNPMPLADDFTQLQKKVTAEQTQKVVEETVNATSARIDISETKKTAEISLQKSIAEDAEDKEKAEQDLQAESELVAAAMQTISEFISMPVRTVNFTQDDGSEKTVIKIFDSESNELIKQFPSEEVLMIAQRIVELQQDISQKTGILLDESI